MTDDPKKSDPTQMQFELRWPNSAAHNAKVATKFAFLPDDTGGTFLLIGNVPPPPWFTPEARQKGRQEVGASLEVEMGGAFYMTQDALLSLYNTLQEHLAKRSRDV